nr:hypothetical protein CFP56_46631 [Quercus suber]
MALPPTPPATPPGSAAPRRSYRWNLLDSNGRAFLADQMNLSVVCFESWLCSPTVQPHLHLWHILCIAGRTRYNTAVEWINAGAQGYFYDPVHLEEDLLLLCLGEGSGASSEGQFADSTLDRRTAAWSTQAVWARCAWRIVEAGQAPGQVFAQRFRWHPAACYAVVIDLVCIAFHSIAFRGHGSWYEHAILGTIGSWYRTPKLTMPRSPESPGAEAKDEDEGEDDDEEASTTILTDHEDEYEGSSIDSPGSADTDTTSGYFDEDDDTSRK